MDPGLHLQFLHKNTRGCHIAYFCKRSVWQTSFVDDIPVCEAAGSGWIAQASSASSRSLLLSVALFEVFLYNQQTPSKWFPCYSASPWHLRISIYIQVCSNTGNICCWDNSMHLMKTYGSLDFGIRAPNSFILSFILNLLLLSTAQSTTCI